jgi:hypothetical protein
MNRLDMINKIRKLAEAGPGTKVTSTSPNSGTAPSGEATPSSKADISAIQNVMREISDMVKENVGSTYGGKDYQNTGSPAAQTKTRDAFDNFFVQNYMADKEDLRTRPANFGTDPLIKGDKQKPKSLTSAIWMSNIMDTVARTGNSLKERSEDGVWGFRTDQAFVSIVAFTQSAFELMEDLGVGGTFYTRDQLKQLIDLKEQVARTAQATGGAHVKIIKPKVLQKIAENFGFLFRFYENFYRKTVRNEYFSRFIDGSSPLAEYSANPARSTDLDEEEKNALSAAKGTDYTPYSMSTEDTARLQQLEAYKEKATTDLNNTLGRPDVLEQTKKDFAREVKEGLAKADQEISEINGRNAANEQDSYLKSEKQVRLKFSQPITTQIKQLDKSESNSEDPYALKPVTIDSIPLSALDNKTSFESWFKSVGFEAGGTKDQTKIALLKAIQARLNSQKSDYVSKPSVSNTSIIDGFKKWGDEHSNKTPAAPLPPIKPSNQAPRHSTNRGR